MIDGTRAAIAGWYAERLDWGDGDAYWAVFAPDPDAVDPADPDVLSLASPLDEEQARLIAAAPAMLAALDQVAAMTRGIAAFARLRDEVLAAVAAASGETTW